MRSFVWVVVAIAATLTLMARAARAGDDPLPRPTYEIGHIWPLADSMYELVRLDDDVYVFASPNGEIRLTKSLGLVGVRRDEDFVEVSPGAQLTWPLKPGDWGTSRTEWSASRPTPTPWGRQKWGMAARRMTTSRLTRTRTTAAKRNPKTKESQVRAGYYARPSSFARKTALTYTIYGYTVFVAVLCCIANPHRRRLCIPQSKY